MSVVDCTIGRAGHASAITELLGDDGLYVGLDADPRNLAFAANRLEKVRPRVRLFHANFIDLPEVLEAVGIGQVDAIFADLGISTNQLFEAEYGLSFSQPMPLDMRIDPRSRQSAQDIIRTWPEQDLANVLYEFAQERYSRRIAKNICAQRRISPITTTDRLAEIVRSAVPKRGGAPEKIDPATRTFLALRMLVNQELGNLESLLETAPKALSVGGRFAVISFQSMEDRLVKQAFRSLEQAEVIQILTKKPLCPDESEIADNPRSRSAKLRVAEKLEPKV